MLAPGASIPMHCKKIKEGSLGMLATNTIICVLYKKIEKMDKILA
jgi:hypothetical protein